MGLWEYVQTNAHAMTRKVRYVRFLNQVRLRSRLTSLSNSGVVGWEVQIVRTLLASLRQLVEEHLSLLPQMVIWDWKERARVSRVF